jgi:hypothetical protein
MTTAGTVRPPPVLGAAPVVALAGMEMRRAGRNLLLWLGTAGCAALAWPRWLSGAEPHSASATENYEIWTWSPGPLYMAAFLAANAVALRERPATTAELFVNTPVGRTLRTVGVLTAAVVPAGFGLAVVLVNLALIVRAGGITVGSAPYTTAWAPALAEVVVVPVTAGLAWASGVAMARTIGSRAVGAVVGVVGTYMTVTFWLWNWFPGYLMAVVRTSLVPHDLGTAPTRTDLAVWPAVELPGRRGERFRGLERDLPLFAGHLIFLVGLTVLLAGWALVRSGPERRSRWVLAVGGALVLGGLLAQLLTYDLPLRWGGLP